MSRPSLDEKKDDAFTTVQEMPGLERGRFEVAHTPSSFAPNRSV
jgi:hypothetical protein